MVGEGDVQVGDVITIADPRTGNMLFTVTDLRPWGVHCECHVAPDTVVPNRVSYALISGVWRRQDGVA